MRNLFIVLGLIISTSFIMLALSLTGFILLSWSPIIYGVKAEFVVFVLSCLSFVGTLIFIPHGRRN